MLGGGGRAQRGDGIRDIVLGQRDHIHVAFDHQQPPQLRVMDARLVADRTVPIPYEIGVSGELRYLGVVSPSSARPPKAMTRPRRSRIGKMMRSRKRSRDRPCSSRLAKPAAIRSANRGTGPVQCLAQIFPAGRRVTDPEGRRRSGRSTRAGANNRPPVAGAGCSRNCWRKETVGLGQIHSSKRLAGSRSTAASGLSGRSAR
jgi:hypothetical protein